MSIHAFLPCRQGSERVPRKNIKPFAGFNNGLVEIKLSQLLSCPSIDEVVLSTNDDDILEFVSTIKNKKLTLHKRNDELCSSSTSTDELIKHALDLVPQGNILWTHVTSPFVNSYQYELIIQEYFKRLDQGYDSLMTTSLIRGFLWNKDGAINYERDREKWPRTQTIDPVHEINSAVFLNSSANYKDIGDRIGLKPYLSVLDKFVGHDVDWPDDFVLAEAMAMSGVAKL